MVPPLEAWSAVPEIGPVALTLAEPWRWVLGLLGATLLVFGRSLSDRAVHVAVLAGAFEVGHLLVTLTDAWPEPGGEFVRHGTIALLASAALWVADQRARAALVLPGAALGLHLVGGVLGPMAVGVPFGWAVVAASAALVPFAWEPAAVVLAPLLGASVLSIALGHPSPAWVAPMWGVGVLVQLFRQRQGNAG